MTQTIPAPDAYQDMRDALRSLCSSFDSTYWQKVDHERGYPEAFVNALTTAGWLAALIPAEYGGSGLGLVEASVIMEEVNLSGGNWKVADPKTLAGIQAEIADRQKRLAAK